MVVFTCGHCGESVQKPKVEKHYMTKCRNRDPNLSCMDCFKDFYGQDYESHTKCITEEQRYSGKGFVAKEKKGEQKQNAWVEMVQSVLDEQKDAPKNVLRIIESVSKHTNTPRKKPKFINFVKNVCGHKTNPKDIEAAWDLISVKLSALSNAQKGSQDLKIEASLNNLSVNDKSALNDECDEEKEVASEKEHDMSGQAMNSTEVVNEKKSKKQKKEEKKKQKYEAALQSAAIPMEENVEVVEEEKKLSKKEKKLKNKLLTAVTNDEDDESDNKSNKISKRKRTDTITEVVNGGNENDINKTKKKKNVESDESISLHDQNVAVTEELVPEKQKFDWHETILYLLQKKGEMQFKRLQKKVLSAYSEATGEYIDDRIADKFIKKLKSAPNVRVEKNKVVIEDL